MDGVREAGAKAIRELSKKLGALQFDEFQLTSGTASSYYFDGRVVTLDPEGAYRVGMALLPLVVDSGAQAVAGPAVAAVPIVTAVGVAGYLEGTPIPGLIVRSESKRHGTMKRIEGTVTPGTKVAVVDDTCSTGGSVLDAIEAVEEAGCSVVKVVCILDRQMGGSDEIRRRGYDFTALLEATEGGDIALPAR